MNITILCDQKDCLYYEKGNRPIGICISKCPILYLVNEKRQCFSKYVKHVKHAVDPCANCEEQDIDACANCCHKNFHKKTQ